MTVRKYIKDYIGYTQFQYEIDFIFMSNMEADKKRKNDIEKRYYSILPIQKFHDLNEDEILKKLGWNKKIIDAEKNKINFFEN